MHTTITQAAGGGYFEAYRDYLANAGSYAVPYSEFAGALGVIPDAVKVGLIGWAKRQYEEATMNANENYNAGTKFEEEYWYHIYTSFQTGKFGVPAEAQQMKQG